MEDLYFINNPRYTCNICGKKILHGERILVDHRFIEYGDCPSWHMHPLAKLSFCEECFGELQRNYILLANKKKKEKQENG